MTPPTQTTTCLRSTGASWFVVVGALCGRRLLHLPLLLTLPILSPCRLCPSADSRAGSAHRDGHVAALYPAEKQGRLDGSQPITKRFALTLPSPNSCPSPPGQRPGNKEVYDVFGSALQHQRQGHQRSLPGRGHPEAAGGWPRDGAPFTSVSASSQPLPLPLPCFCRTRTAAPNSAPRASQPGQPTRPQCSRTWPRARLCAEWRMPLPRTRFASRQSTLPSKRSRPRFNPSNHLFFSPSRISPQGCVSVRSAI